MRKLTSPHRWRQEIGQIIRKANFLESRVYEVPWSLTCRQTYTSVSLSICIFFFLSSSFFCTASFRTGNIFLSSLSVSPAHPTENAFSASCLLCFENESVTFLSSRLDEVHAHTLGGGKKRANRKRPLPPEKKPTDDPKLETWSSFSGLELPHSVRDDLDLFLVHVPQLSSNLFKLQPRPLLETLNFGLHLNTERGRKKKRVRKGRFFFSSSQREKERRQDSTLLIGSSSEVGRKFESRSAQESLVLLFFAGVYIHLLVY